MYVKIGDMSGRTSKIWFMCDCVFRTTRVCVSSRWLKIGCHQWCSYTKINYLTFFLSKQFKHQNRLIVYSNRWFSYEVDEIVKQFVHEAKRSEPFCIYYFHFIRCYSSVFQCKVDRIDVPQCVLFFLCRCCRFCFVFIVFW